MDPDFGEGRVRLLALIAESDVIVNECRGSDDPVAVRKVIDALIDKALALSDLDRVEEAIAVWNQLLGPSIDLSDRERLWTFGQKVWAASRLDSFTAVVETADELLRLFDELGCPDDRVSIAARALTWKAYALDRLGHPERAIRADDELVHRFGDTPAVSGRVAWALGNKAILLLELPDRLDEALAASEQLRKRMELEPDETLAQVAKATAAHVLNLGKMASSPIGGYATLAGLSLAGATVELIRSAHAVLSRVQPRIGEVPIPAGVDDVVARFGPVDRRRRQLAQVLAISQTLLRRVNASQDPDVQQLAATAKMAESFALIGLGHIRKGLQASEPVIDGETAGAAPAFQGLADRLPTDTRLLTQLARMTMLRSRANVLAKGDTAIAKIAFDESIDRLPHEVGETRLGRVTAWLIRPKGDSALDVPEFPPEADSPDT